MHSPKPELIFAASEGTLSKRVTDVESYERVIATFCFNLIDHHDILTEESKRFETLSLLIGLTANDLTS